MVDMLQVTTTPSKTCGFYQNNPTHFSAQEQKIPGVISQGTHPVGAIKGARVLSERVGLSMPDNDSNKHACTSATHISATNFSYIIRENSQQYIQILRGFEPR